MADAVAKTKRVRKKDTTFSDRQTIFYACRASMQNGRLRNGIQTELAKQLGFERKTICRQWTRMQRLLAPFLNNQDEEDHDTIIQQNAHILFGTGHSDRRKGKFKYDRDDLLAQITAVPLKEGRSVRKLAARMGLPPTTIQNILKPKDGLLKSHVSKLKPTLTEVNKLSRFEFAMEQINTATMGNRSPKFFAQYDKVHINEKWFNLCKDGENYILVDGEEPPLRQVKHKIVIDKVLFLCAQARPRWDQHTNSMWDGKLGIWPIGKYTFSQQNSANGPVSTKEWVNETMDQESHRDMLVNNVLTSIMDKWPVGQFNDPSFVIKVQQDGAGGHCSHSDEYLNDAIEELGLAGKVMFYTQPANSPDLNILDLGLFRALQSAYYDTAPKNAVELIEMVEKTYDEYPWKKINRLFVTLQTIFNYIIEDHGGNNYNITHMNKEPLEKEDRLPIAVEVTDEAQQYMVPV